MVPSGDTSSWHIVSKSPNPLIGQPAPDYRIWLYLLFLITTPKLSIYSTPNTYTTPI
jgi:hypothetical protein